MFFYTSIKKFQGLLFICWSTLVQSYKSFLWKLVDLARNKKYGKTYTSHNQLFRWEANKLNSVVQMRGQQSTRSTNTHTHAHTHTHINTHTQSTWIYRFLFPRKATNTDSLHSNNQTFYFYIENETGAASN